MKLTLEQLRSITRGAVEVEESHGAFTFHRFTEKQQDCYREYRSLDFFGKTFSGSGIRLAFKTDATHLSFGCRMAAASSRPYGWFDIYENGIMIAHEGGEGKLFSFDKIEIALSEGVKMLEVYFPWSKAAALTSVELDGKMLEPIKRRRVMLCFGDSITQGYDAIYPSLSYVSRLGRMLDADEYNKGIGGDTFFPELLSEREELSPGRFLLPDIVTVAYGTNDWNTQPREQFEKNCREFYERICVLYPTAAKYAITPIWRADGTKETKFAEPHTALEAIIRELTADLPVTVIPGYELAPQVTSFYSDSYLHPNDLGFGEYANKLVRFIK